MKNKIFLTSHEVDLIRLGNNFDGGYLIPKIAVKNSKILISFGLGTDWSFEKSFKEMNKNIKIYCYDHTVNRRFWYEHTLISLFFFIKNLKNFKDIFCYFRYKKFFLKNNIKHEQKKIVSKKFNSSDISISEIVKQYKNHQLFLKIDIEGDEYRILDKIKNFKKLISFVIEFHNIDLHYEKINTFLKKNKNFKIVHAHPNNMGGVNEKMEPLTVEITFINLKTFKDYRKIKPRYIKKRKIDFPNDPYKKDISLN